MSAERRSYSGHRLNNPVRRRVAAITTSLALTAAGGAASADIIPFPSRDTRLATSIQYPAIVAKDPAISNEMLDVMANSTPIVTTSFDVSGSSPPTISCGAAIVENPGNHGNEGLITAAHCLDPYGNTDGKAVYRSTLAERTTGLRITLFRGKSQSPPLHDVWFVNNKGWNDSEFAMGASESDSVLIEGANGKDIMDLPFAPAPVTEQPLAVGQTVAFVAPVVDNQAYAGTVTGTVTGPDGHPMTRIEFNSLNGKQAVRGGVSGSALFTMEDDVAKVAGVLVAGQFGEGENSTNIGYVSQTAVRNIIGARKA